MDAWAERVARDWPPERTAVQGGWRFGTAGGVTKRANSAVYAGEPAGGGPVPDPGAVTRFYTERGLRPCAQVWPGEERADARLAEHGYAVVEPSLVLARPLTGPPAAAGAAEVADAPQERWRELLAADAGSPAHAAGTLAILGRVRAGYGVLKGGGGRGCIVLDGERAAVCAMATAPGARGRGVAGAVLADLLAWACARGARRAYLCVVDANAPARRLYRSAGFAPVSRYHYRVLE